MHSYKHVSNLGLCLDMPVMEIKYDVCPVARWYLITILIGEKKKTGVDAGGKRWWEVSQFACLLITNLQTQSMWHHRA